MSFCKDCQGLSVVLKDHNERLFHKKIWEIVKETSRPYGVAIVCSPNEINNPCLIDKDDDLVWDMSWTTRDDLENYRPEWIERGIAEVMIHNGCLLLKGVCFGDTVFSISCHGKTGHNETGKCNIRYCETEIPREIEEKK